MIIALLNSSFCLAGNQKTIKFSAKSYQKDSITGSGITFTKINDQEVKNLALLGEVWGFLKYHHPEIASGNYNWDNELFKILEETKSASTNKERDQILLDWINSFGEIKKNKTNDTEYDAYLKPDHEWITTEISSAELQNKLLEIYENRISSSKMHYVDYASKNVKNPAFLNEEAYENIPYPETGIRLVGLFRYWNIIHYFYPYKDIIDKNWNSILSEYIPEFVETKNELEYEKVFLKLIAEVKDTHANLAGETNEISKELGTYFPPVHLRFINDQLVIDDIYESEKIDQLPVKVGDVITKINGKKISEIVEEKIPYSPASNQATRLRNISYLILRNTESSSNIQIKNENGLKEVELPLFKYDDLDFYLLFRQSSETKSYKILEDNIGYIDLGIIKQKEISDIKKELIDTKGIVVDIRNYPNDFVVYSLGRFLVPKRNSFVKFTTMNLNNPGEFNFDRSKKLGSNKKSAYQGKVVLLVDERTQSQAEFTAMGFQASPNTTVIGSTTAGADGNYSRIILPGGLATGISGIGVFYPDGSPTQRIGILPDIEITPSLEGIRNGKDELLEKAIEVINK
ncbi:Peptidase family S41 [Zunongwangia mangrovi]|uniref:Peptidase family S41 n=1 Tax=Zunongwangia mangrovi TaxID=1334022 RepID=A0A1I1DX58_9FLAO|nr:S41 family peptidase [Zunongwangia mangrovi]SFB77618.1 Peptidase family S41 [Zunongwangia mangrovi]